VVTERQNLAVLRATKFGAKGILMGERKEKIAGARYGWNAGLTGKSPEL
jgi:hypothetical protein